MRGSHEVQLINMYVWLDVTVACHKKHIEIDISLLQAGICSFLSRLWFETGSFCT